MERSPLFRNGRRFCFASASPPGKPAGTGALALKPSQAECASSDLAPEAFDGYGRFGTFWGDEMKKGPQRFTMWSAVLGIAFCSSTPMRAAGALAVGKCGVDGYSFNNATTQEAEDAALSNCGPGCRIVFTLRGNCAAFATDVNKSCGAEGWGSGTERGAAEDVAIHECINHGGEQCDVKRWVCDGGG
jgi:hypothetical protein